MHRAQFIVIGRGHDLLDAMNTGQAALTWLSAGSGSDRIDQGRDLLADGVPATGVGIRY